MADIEIDNDPKRDDSLSDAELREATTSDDRRVRAMALELLERRRYRCGVVMPEGRMTSAESVAVGGKKPSAWITIDNRTYQIVAETITVIEHPWPPSLGRRAEER